MFDEDEGTGEDIDPIKSADALLAMSVHELESYKKQLEAEVDRVTAEIEKKETYRQSLDSVFKS